MIEEQIGSASGARANPPRAGDAPLVSIITICFKNPADLRLTLASLVGVDTGRVEMLVVDGSPDDSCTAAVEQSPLPIRYLHGRDGGKYDAMNKGLSHIRGQAALMLNSGDALIDALRFSSLIAAHAPLLATHILYGDSSMLFGARSVLRRAPATMNPPQQPFPSHQATLVPKRFYETELYDPTMEISADAKLLSSAYTQLPSLHVGEAIAVFAYGGISSCERSWGQVWQHYQEHRAHNAGNPIGNARFLARLSARRLFVALLGARRLLALQAALASRRAARY